MSDASNRRSAALGEMMSELIEKLLGDAADYISDRELNYVHIENVEAAFFNFDNHGEITHKEWQERKEKWTAFKAYLYQYKRERTETG